MKFVKALILATLAWSALAQADVPATHGMLIFGHKVTYASHLPMFHHPHDYQVVMQISLVSNQTGVLSQYEQLKAAGETLFTIAPKPMDLTKVMNSVIRQFPAELFQGHFERGGKKLGDVFVRVDGFIVKTKLDPNAPEKDQFVMFGVPGEFFAAHLINGKPSYDTIVKLSQPYTLSTPTCNGRVCPDPVKVPITDGKWPATVTYISTTDSRLPGKGQTLGLLGGPLAEVEKVIYAEEAELAH